MKQHSHLGSISRFNSLFRLSSVGILRYVGLLSLALSTTPSLAQSSSSQPSASLPVLPARTSVINYGDPLPPLSEMKVVAQQPATSLTSTAEAASSITSIGVSQGTFINPSLKPFTVEFTSLDISSAQAQAGSPSDSTARPTFVPRAFARYTNRGAGYLEGYTALGAFVPLDLDADLGLTFFEGQLLIQNNSALGANAILGHRFYDPALEAVYGGYVAYDFRNTGRSSFSQIGIGLEYLSSVFDARINGYFPFGAIRNQVASSSTGFGFVGNSLVLSGFRQFETAATVVDAEVGREIIPIGSNGSLRAYAGTYLISAQGSPTVVGVKGRIEALPTDFLNVGVSVQNDSLFDTRVVFTVGASFPGSSPQGVNVPQTSALNRIAENVGRQSAIVVADPTVSGQTEGTSEVARNPNGTPYRFLHVRQGAGGTGTNESPFTSVQVALANDAAGDIIYVRGSGAESFVPSLDPGVTLLFSRVEQRLPLLGGGTVVLPGSANPSDSYTITATGSLGVGSNSRVSGLTIIPNAGQPGITATGVSNITLDRNTVTTTNASGIILQNVSGNVTVSNNTVNATGVGTDGISVANNAGNVNLNITGNTATGGNNGISVALTGTATGGGTISNNTLRNSRNAGIFVVVDTPDATAQRVFTISNNIVEDNNTGGSVAPGIQVEARNNAQLRVTLDSNVVRNNVDGGVGLFTSGTGTATLFAQVRLNTLTGNGALIGDLDANIFPGANNTRICIQPSNNTIGTFNRRNNAAGTSEIQIEGALPGTNTITSTPAAIGNVTTVAAGTCGF